MRRAVTLAGIPSYIRRLQEASRLHPRSHHPRTRQQDGARLRECDRFGRSRQAAFFLFLYFLKMFFIEIYFWFHNLQFYTPTARQGGGRQADRPVGGAGSPNIKAEVPHLHLQQTTSIEGKRRDFSTKAKAMGFTILMDSYVTYLQITSAQSGRTSLLQLPPAPQIGPYRPVERRQAGRPPGRGAAGSPNIKTEVPHLHLQQTTSIEGKMRDVG